MSHLFYRAFEDRHRGSRELIKDRLRAYLPFLHPLASALAPARALDLGCGRGEWLELLGEQGFTAHGVDLDEGMLAACRERGLDVETQDALSSLRAQGDASLALVSGFHLIEHISFDDVQALIVEALRVLQPGGLLIMETPNPENLVVATSGFYMDPSHLRPIPPQLLEFVVEFHGFGRRRVVRLQEPVQLAEPAAVALLNVLNAVSPDYSVVAQKAAPEPVAQQFDHAFSLPFGLTLDALAERYDAQRNHAHHALQHDMAVLGERVRVAEHGSAELFRLTLDTIHAAQTIAHGTQQELDNIRQRERHLEEHAHRLALNAAEARIAQSVSHADAISQRLLVAEQRAFHAEQRVLQLEQEAAALRGAVLTAEQTMERAAIDTETVAASYYKKTREIAQQQLLEAKQLTDESVMKVADLEQLVAEAEQRAATAEQRAKEAEQHVASGSQPAAEAAQATSHQLRHELSQANAEVHHLRHQVHALQAYASGIEQTINAMYASSSWRITKPARAAISLLQKARKRDAVPAQVAPSQPGTPVAAPAVAPSNTPAVPSAAAPSSDTAARAAMSPEAEKVFQQLLRSAQPDQSTK